MPVDVGSAHGIIKIGYDGAGIGSALAGLGGLVTTVQAVGGAIKDWIIDPLADVAKAAVSVATDFEAQMALLDLASGSTADGLGGLEDVVLAIGGDTRLVGISASGAAEALTNFYKAGLDTGEVLGDVNAYMEENAELTGAMRAAVDLAAASSLDLGQASDVVSVAMATFGLGADEAVGIANSFVQAADASVAEVDGLVEAFRRVGPSASQLGIGLGDANNALALLSTAGIQGSSAGSVLDAMLRGLSSPTDAAKDAMDGLGISLFDAEGNFRSLPDIIGQFEDSLSGTQKVMVEVGGRTLAQNKELARLKKMYASTELSLADYTAGVKGAGLSEKARTKKLAGLRQQLLNLDESMLPLLQIQGELVASTKTLTEEERAAALGTIFTAQGQRAMNVLLGQGVEGWNGMTEATAAAATAQDVAAVKADTFKGSLETLEGVMETLLIQVGQPLIDNFLRPAAEWLSATAEEHGPAFIEFFGEVSEAIAPFVQWLLALVDEGDAMNSFFVELPEPIRELVQWLTVAVPAAIKFVSDVWYNVLLPAFFAVSAFIQEHVVPVLVELWGWFMQLLPLAIQVLVDYYEGYLAPIWESMKEAWEETVKPALLDLWEWLKLRVPDAIAALVRFWDTAGKPMFEFFGWIIAEWVVPILAKLFAWLAKTIPEALDIMAKSWKEDLWPAILVVWEWIRDTLIPGFLEVKDWLATTLTAALTTLSEFWEETLLPAIKAVWEFVDEYLIPLFTEIVELFEVILAKAIEVLVGVWETKLYPAIEAVWELIEKYLQPVLDVLLEYWEESLQPALEEVARILIDVLLDAWDKLKEAWGKLGVLDKVVEAFDSIKKSLKKAAEWVGSVKAAISSVKIPSWLVGRSPPPMAEWFTDIAEATRQLAATELPLLQSSLDFAAANPLITGSGSTSTYRGGDINVEAKYAFQDEKTLREDLRMMQLRQEAMP